MTWRQLRSKIATDQETRRGCAAWLVAFAFLLICVAAGIANAADVPAVDIPPSQREANWPGSEGDGSCVHASLVTLMRWQARPHSADYWRLAHENGESPSSLTPKLDAAEVRYAMTAGECDVRFLQWAVDTRRGCGVTVHGGGHMVLLVHLDAEYAGIIDPNFPDRVAWYSRDSFLAHWCASNSWAIAVVYSPLPPRGAGE